MRTLFVLCAALLFSACSTIGAFNALTPDDPGARRVVQSARYGEGPRRTLDLYAPEHAEARAPVLVFFYGGAWNSGRKDDHAFIGRAFAAQGFITLIPDYRVAPDVFPSFIEDGAAAVRWARDHAAEYGGDPDRIVLAGHSSGGYIAIMLALDPHYLRGAGVDISAIRGAAGLAGPYRFYPFDSPITRAAFGAAPDPQATQPLYFARADAPPLLLLTGDEDQRVNPNNVNRLADAIRAAGGPVETRIYAGIGHPDILLALSRPLRGAAPVLADVTSFARRVTAP